MSDEGKTLWFCAAVGVRVVAEQSSRHTSSRRVETHLTPFAVRAANYREAAAVADEVMAKVRDANPGWQVWDVRVNRAGEAGVVNDPSDIRVF